MVLLTLDDRNPDIIYSNGWNHAGSALEFNRTTTWTAVAGSTAQLTFQGTGVSVFGTIGEKDGAKSVAPVSAYSIDGGTPVTFTAVEKARAQTSQQFYQSPLLPDGVHTLTITNTLASDPLFLDFLMVLSDSDADPAPSSIVASVSSSSAASSSSSSTSSASTTSSSSSSIASSSSSTTPVPTFTVTSVVDPSTTSLTPSASADPDSTGATKKSNSTAIAGGIIAGVVGVIIIVFALLFWYRRHKRRSEFRDMMDSNPDRFWAPVANNSSSSVQPFASESAPPPRATATPMSQTQAQPSASYAYDQPRYPGGYTPAEAYNNSAYANHAASAQGPGYAPSNHSSYYGHAQQQQYTQNQSQAQGYPSRGYVPPSQLLNSYLG